MTEQAQEMPELPAFSDAVKKAVEAVKEVDNQLTKEVIPQDLKEKHTTLVLLSEMFKLLNEGLFPHYKHPLIQKCMAFTRNLHDPLLVDALAHPQADLFPDLKKLNDEKKAGVKQ